MTGPISIVALLPSPQSVRPCLDCALAAAAGLDAAIAAVHLGFDPRGASADPEEVDLQALRDRAEGRPEDRSARTRAAYDAWLERNRPGVPVAWKDEEGEVSARAAAATAAADLVVMRNPAHLDGHDALHGVLFGSRRLLLVAPPEPLPGPLRLGRHIVVGWKPGPHAERALAAARPWLRNAERLTLVSVERPGRDYEPSGRAALAALGLVAEPVVVAPAGPSVGRQLLAEARRLGGDSLLIGACRHGALWQAILGGVTRDVLAEAGLPVFMQG